MFPGSPPHIRQSASCPEPSTRWPLASDQHLARPHVVKFQALSPAHARGGGQALCGKVKDSPTSSKDPRWCLGFLIVFVWSKPAVKVSKGSHVYRLWQVPKRRCNLHLTVRSGGEDRLVASGNGREVKAQEVILQTPVFSSGSWKARAGLRWPGMRGLGSLRPSSQACWLPQASPLSFGRGCKALVYTAVCKQLEKIISKPNSSSLG